MAFDTLIVALATLASVALVTLATLRGWQGWLTLRMRELDRTGGAGPASSPAARIELADLKERVRQLEAIAAGVDP